MWQEFADMLPRIWTQEEITYDVAYCKIPRREVSPKPLRHPTRRCGRPAVATRPHARPATFGWEQSST
jgi:hypothetical protein